MAVPNYISTNRDLGLLFLLILTHIYYLLYFDYSHSDRCQRIPRCGFYLYFPAVVMWSIFSCVCWPSGCRVLGLRSNACPLVSGARPGLLMAQAISRVSCELRWCSRQPICWQMSLCPHPVNCLAWCIPALVPSWFCLGPSLGVNKPRWQILAAVFMRLNVPKYVLHQCPCPQHEL